MSEFYCEGCYLKMSSDEKDPAFPFCEYCEQSYFRCFLCGGYHKIILYKEKKRSTCLTYQCLDHNSKESNKNGNFKHHNLSGTYSRIHNMVTIIYHSVAGPSNSSNSTEV